MQCNTADLFNQFSSSSFRSADSLNNHDSFVRSKRASNHCELIFTGTPELVMMIMTGYLCYKSCRQRWTVNSVIQFPYQAWI